MGKYINIGNAEFESVRKDEYVDKSMLIAYVNKVLGTQRKFLCVTRARRFGKSIAAKMLNAYYDESVNSHALFHDLNIAKDPSYEPHLNKYPVIYLDASGFTSELTSDRLRVVHEMKKHECLIECLSNKSVLSSDRPVLSQDKNVLSLLKICPKLNSKQGSKALAVLRVVGEGEISVADLMKRVGGTNRSRFKAQLIDPFVEALLIAPTIPDKPNSSKQRYYLPQKGIELLKQLTQ